MSRRDEEGPGPGLHGCPLCDEPPPHGHDLGVILNAMYYCPDGQRHAWGSPSRWRHLRRRARCGYRER